MSAEIADPIKIALADAVRAYLRLHHGHVIVPKLYEVFHTWHPSVTRGLLYEIIQDTLVVDCEDDAPPLPVWDGTAGVLYYAKYLIKEFKRPAPNQRRILDVFERLEWRNEIRNPFLEDRIPADIAAETLRNATEALNDDHLSVNFIRFGTRDRYSFAHWQAFSASS